MQFCFVYDRTGSIKTEARLDEIVRKIITAILSRARIDNLHGVNKRVRFNEYENLSEPELYYVVNDYKQKCCQIINKSISVLTSMIRSNRLIYKGTHETYFCFHDLCRITKGYWQIELMPIEGIWLAVDIQVEGIDH
jgi:hypothetical protein